MQLTEAWKGWHDIGAPMREPYEEFAALANEGARELGFKDLGVMWRAGYDMSPEQFDQESERLWQQVKPLYEQLHCHARAQLAKKYGEDKVPAGKPIPAQLFGNMWAQQWNKIYDDMLKPYPAARASRARIGSSSAQNWDAVRMTRSAESFYTSIGFPKLPQTFWERSMLTRPRDREVVCHASAWDMSSEPGNDDVRIKMCIQPDRRRSLHGLSRARPRLLLPHVHPAAVLFQDGANDGFHEAIGDTVNLSVTPGYLRASASSATSSRARQAVINQQMKVALEKIAFLPFGRLIDQWRWKVFSGEITPANYNSLVVGAAQAVPGHRPAGAAHRGRLRSRRQIPHSRQHALHALFPLLHPAVPVPQGAVRGGGIQRAAA